VNFYSLEREAQLGRETAAGLERTLPIVHDARLDAYVAQLAANLARQGDSPFTYTFTVYDDRKPVSATPGVLAMPADAFQRAPAEPVAIAGGTVFVPLSLLAGAPNEAEFAFQLAHAMAHIALRHSTKMATRIGIAQIATQTPSPPGWTGNTTQPAIPLGFITFARQHELEADFLATRMVAGAGYDPQAAMEYLQAQPEPSRSLNVFSMHPTGRQRVDVIGAVLKTLPARTYAPDSAGFADAKALAAAVH